MSIFSGRRRWIERAVAAALVGLATAVGAGVAPGRGDPGPPAGRPAPAASPARTSGAPWPGAGFLEAEPVTERYPDGRVKIEKTVVLDEDCNYVQHGLYTEYRPDGRLRRTGEYRMGKKHGPWTQHFDAGEGQLFSGELDDQFPGPFTSEATFHEGRLHGTWTITSGSGSRIIQWHFDHGVREGPATWWYPNGSKRLEASYRKGLAEGTVRQWAPDGTLVAATRYVAGRPLVRRIQWYSPARKQYEGTVLTAAPPTPLRFDWWTTTVLPETSKTGAGEVKHGPWTVWHENGQKKTEGVYQLGLPVGRFTWWYPNGQKQAEGTYREGREEGLWITWHPNGMKESVAHYRDGRPVGTWLKWAPDGQLLKMQHHDAGGKPHAAEQPGR